MLSTSNRPCRTVVRGFTLIELMTVMAVVAVMAALAAPAVREQIANFRIRSAAEGIVAGLNLARAEAARRNSPVTLTLSATGGGWEVAQVSPALTIQSRSGGETAGITVASSTASLVATFLPTGIVDTSGAARLEQVTVSSDVPRTNSRRINILGGGLIRLCDPGVVDSSDARAC
jgi:type IV fimbrial biogenesis protein FimT